MSSLSVNTGRFVLAFCVFSIAQFSAQSKELNSIEVAPSFPFIIPLNNKDYRVALMDRKGDIVFKPEALNISTFVKVDDETWLAPAQSSNNGKWGYIDQNGKWIVEAKFDQARVFANDKIARIEINSKWGFIKPDGSYLVDPIYLEVRPYYSGRAIVKKDKTSYLQVLNTKGELAFKKDFLKITDFSSNGLAAAQKDRSFLGKISKSLNMEPEKPKWGYIDRDGNWVIEPRFDSADKFNEYGTAKVWREKVMPPPIKIISVLIESLWNSESDEKRREKLTDLYGSDSYGYGIIDEKGSWVVEPKYLILHDFSESGIAWVIEQGQYPRVQGYIDTKGKLLWEGNHEDYKGEHNGLMLNHHKSNIFVDPYGKTVIKDESIQASNFYDKDVTVALRETSKEFCDNQVPCTTWGILHRNGKFNPFDNNVLAPFTYKENDDAETTIRFQHGLLAVVTKKGEIVYYNREGDIAFKLQASEDNKLALFDAEGKVRWQSKTEPFHTLAFFLPDEGDHFKDIKDYKGGIINSIKKLLVEKPRLYDSSEGVYPDPDDYTDEDLSDFSFGAFKNIASADAVNNEWNAYYYFDAHLKKKFNQYANLLEKQISHEYGPPIHDLKTKTTTSWTIDGKRLELIKNIGWWNSKHAYQIVLELKE